MGAERGLAAAGESWFGTEGPDSHEGTAGNDDLWGIGGNDTLWGLKGNDHLIGADGDDLLRGEGGVDWLEGDAGNDTAIGGGSSDNLFGGIGADLLLGGGWNDDLHAGLSAESLDDQSPDVLSGGGGNDFLFELGKGDRADGGAGFDYAYFDLTWQVAGRHFALNDEAQLGGGTSWKNVESGILRLGSGDDTVVGGTWDGNVIGGGGDDILAGGTEAHSTYRLNGGDGDDVLITGSEYALMTGGTGADVFRFRAFAENRPYFDRIFDLEDAVDVIDLSLIDADGRPKNGDQAFALVTEFSGNRGEMRVWIVGNATVFDFDRDGDGSAESDFVVAGDHAGFSNFVL